MRTVAVTFFSMALVAADAASHPAGEEFFEKSIRPQWSSANAGPVPFRLGISGQEPRLSGTRDSSHER